MAQEAVLHQWDAAGHPSTPRLKASYTGIQALWLWEGSCQRKRGYWASGLGARGSSPKGQSKTLPRGYCWNNPKLGPSIPKFQLMTPSMQLNVIVCVCVCRAGLQGSMVAPPAQGSGHAGDPSPRM